MEGAAQTPRTIKLVDSLFSTPSFGMDGENADKKPKTISWDRTPGDAPIKVFTDTCLDLAEDDLSKTKIALLIESPAMATEPLKEIRRIHGNFDWILTHDVATARAINRESFGHNGYSKAYWYPLGGCWIDESKIKDTNKTKNISIIASSKRKLKGHWIRFNAGHSIPEDDRYGEMFGRHIESKRDALVPYRYSIVTENCQNKLYFSEKLIDCFASRTIPIYWGHTGVDVLFNGMGVLHWNTLDELDQIISECNEKDYQSRIKAIEDNHKRCRFYKCPEDAIMEYYNFMFI